MSFERDYLSMGMKILREGEIVRGRNGVTKQVFGEQFNFDLKDGFPIITTRKSFYKGVVGEFTALMNAPFNNVEHLREYGVNYWELWADSETGYLNVDYGNEGERVLNKNGDTQMSEIVRMLKEDPHSRRILLNYWNVDHVYDTDNPLSLPCCWYSLQFHVRNEKYLDVLWNQRSCDLAIGIQANSILASMFVIVLGNQCGLEPGRVTMNLGNVHLYEEHWEIFKEQASRNPLTPPSFTLNMKSGASYKDFRPEMLELHDYQHLPAMKYLLKA